MIKNEIPDDFSDDDEFFLAPLPPAEVSMKKYGNAVFKDRLSIENRRLEKLKPILDDCMLKNVENSSKQSKKITLGPETPVQNRRSEDNRDSIRIRAMRENKVIELVVALCKGATDAGLGAIIDKARKCLNVVGNNTFKPCDHL